MMGGGEVLCWIFVLRIFCFFGRFFFFFLIGITTYVSVLSSDEL